EPAQKLDDLELNGDVERGGRLVGDREAGSHDSAIAIIARRRIPPAPGRRVEPIVLTSVMTCFLAFTPEDGGPPRAGPAKARSACRPADRGARRARSVGPPSVRRAIARAS